MKSIFDELKDLCRIKVWGVGKTRTIYDLISNIASCLLTQSHAQEENLICPSVNASKFKSFKEAPFIYSFHRRL